MSVVPSSLPPRRRSRVGLTGLAAVAAVLTAAPSGARGDEALAGAPAPIACPASLAEAVQCVSLRDEAGAWLVIAMPEDWNGRLIVHAHGGPRTAPPADGDSLEDLDRFSVMVREGYAWVGTTYRRGGYGVRSAAEDLDRSRQIFWSLYGRPDRTILHGQSWGGNVAAKAAELYGHAEDGTLAYDGVLLTNGVLNGGTLAYRFRADLRAVYQFYCGNHPSPEEPTYPVWQGLPADSTLTRDELRDRINTCTGVDLAPADRSAQQAYNLRQILAVTGIQEAQLVSHMNWATFLFQDLVQVRLEGRNPFDNTGRRYAGSDDDEALNAGVERFAADPDAVAVLANDADLTGAIHVPTVTLHALHDPTVFHGAEAVYARTVAAAGRSDLLVQVTTDEDQHSRLEDASYLTALSALEAWIDTGERPDPDGFQADCEAMDRGPCRFIPTP